MKSRITWIAVPVAAAAILAGVTGAVVAANSSSTDDSAFVVDHVLTPAVPAGGAFSQSVKELWFGQNVTGFTKVSGPAWLSVDSSGHVTGTAPSTPPAGSSATATITVRGTDGKATSDLTLMVPLLAAGQLPTLEVGSWNLADAGAGASYSAEQKQLEAILANDLQVIGLQETDGRAAATLAHDLGWYSYQSSGDLGIVSAYPISAVTAPTATTPAAGVTLDVDGHSVRVWTAHLDESGYGPGAACASPAPSASQLVTAEKASTRYAQAAAIAQEIAPDVAASKAATAPTPVVLLGDLASPAGTDWTAATATVHCGLGAVSWPVPDLFTGAGGAGLTDSYRQVFPDPAADPGTTLSPLAPASASSSHDRVDYVDYAGPLQVKGAESLVTGSTDAAGDTTTTWPSDHAAAVTLFQLTGGAGGSTPATGSGASAVTGHATSGATGTPDSSGSTGSAGTLQHARPRIAGAARVGKRLTVRVGAWSPTPSYRYQWYAAGRPITGATRAAYRPRAGQRGKRLTVRVTALKAGYISVTVASRATARVR
jgi:hypothetical protein